MYTTAQHERTLSPDFPTIAYVFASSLVLGKMGIGLDEYHNGFKYIYTNFAFTPSLNSPPHNNHTLFSLQTNSRRKSNAGAPDLGDDEDFANQPTHACRETRHYRSYVTSKAGKKKLMMRAARLTLPSAAIFRSPCLPVASPVQHYWYIHLITITITIMHLCSHHLNPSAFTVLPFTIRCTVTFHPTHYCAYVP